MAYATPTLIILYLLSCSLALDLEAYIRYYKQNAHDEVELEQTVTCWLNHDYIWIYLSFVAIIIAGNVYSIIRAMIIAKRNVEIQ